MFFLFVIFFFLFFTPNPQPPTPNSQPPTPNSQLPTPNSQLLYASQDNLEVKGKAEARSVILQGGSVYPTTPVKGELFYRSDQNTHYSFNGSSWQALAGADKTAATKIVAASNSLNTNRADYVCDGTADQVEIQQAIDALGATGGSVYLLEGTYNISASINLNSPAKSIIGTGRGTVLKLVTGSSNVNIFNCSSVASILISNLKIDGNNKTGSSNNGIVFNVFYSKIDHVWVEEMSGDGIDLGIFGEPIFCSDNIISNCSLVSNGATGISMYGARGNIILNNNIELNQDGINAYLGCWDNIISNNSIISNQDDGIGMSTSCTNTIISENNIQSNSDFGVVLLLADNNIISGNNLQLNKAGFRIASSVGNVVTNNNVQTNTEYGIYMTGQGVGSGQTNSCIISNNIIYDNGGSGAFDGIKILSSAFTSCYYNSIFSNFFYDSVGSGRPISITGVNSSDSYIAANLISSWPVGFETIDDAGTNTRYMDKTKITMARSPTALNPGANGTIMPGAATYIALNPTSSYTLSAANSISDGKAGGDLLILENINASWTITVSNSANTRLRLAANKTLAYKEFLVLFWNTIDWIQMGGKD